MTKEPAPDDEEVYGAAWPLVNEWRRLWARHPQRGKGLVWLIDDERILELEVAMLKEHLLTLPPETQPLGENKRSHLQWREAALVRVRCERAQAVSPPLAAASPDAGAVVGVAEECAVRVLRTLWPRWG